MSVESGAYAVFSYDVYNPYVTNLVPLPSGWIRDSALSSGRVEGNQRISDGDNPENSLFGFGAAVYEKSSTGDVVISFRGTEPIGWLPLSDGITELQAGLLGFGTPQLMGAVDFCIEVRKAFPNALPDQITFTGHSLGGGLAA